LRAEALDEGDADGAAAAPDTDFATILRSPCPCDHCLAANDCGSHRLASEAFTAYVDGASEVRWRAIERQPTREQWTKLFELEALKASARLLRQLAKRSRRPVLTPEQRRERWRLASRLRRARNAQRRELSEESAPRSQQAVLP
jgi:hypothetical protein